MKLCRKNATKSSFKYVKVAVDGAPYLRKVDLDSYGSYQQLQRALENVFIGFTDGKYILIHKVDGKCRFLCLTNVFTMIDATENVLNEKKLIHPVNQIEYVTTYEDKDGDWMLVGDVPWT